jgi:putative OPT family oligopeptide transporter
MEHKPYVPASESPVELTVKALVLGSILGILFAASSVYLALKVGMTVSASIPIAVLSITILRALGRSTILENNIVQTAGSAGESIAAGIAFTLPALLLMAHDLEFVRVLLIALLGGVLGVLMMIPLRRGLIVKEHGKLTYPEGTACAQVLIVGEKGGSQARLVFGGFAIGAAYKLLNVVTRLWKETSDWTLKFFKGGSISAEVSPELLGVGFIIGPKVAANMMAGGMLSFLVLIPAIKIFGDSVPEALFPASKLIKDMSPGEIRNAYILYIGAGAVATGGIISLIRSIPTIVAAFRGGWKSFQESRAGEGGTLRTEQDLSMKWVVGGAGGLVLAIALAPMLHINAVSAVLIVIFGFFFVTVSSRITGEIGSSSNPISGMTVATLLITCLLFLAVGWTGIEYRTMALSTAALVCVAASNGGTISQDLKTGYLVGGTPRLQQIAILVGVVTSALAIGWTLLALNDSYTTIVARDYGDYRADVDDDARSQKGPDGETYRVASVPLPDGDVPPGRYLVEDGGRIRFLIDPGVCGTVTEDADGNPVAKLDAPKARLFSLIIDGILTRRLPWGLVLIGVFLALMMELVGVAALPFAVGAYLPISTSVPIMVGGLVRMWVDRKTKVEGVQAESSPGVLLSSGYIAGGALAGLFVAILAGAGVAESLDLSGALGFLSGSDLFALVPFAAIALWMYRIGTRKAV